MVCFSGAYCGGLLTVGAFWFDVVGIFWVFVLVDGM